MGNDKKWVLLNVGGTIFKTTRTTLAKSNTPSSPLFRISSCSTNVEWDRDESGAYCIDRDPTYFQPVLNYLRYGKLILNHNISEEGVLLEAEHFNIPELCKLIRQRIANNHLSAIRAQQSQQQYAFETIRMLIANGVGSKSNSSTSSTASNLIGCGSQHIKLPEASDESWSSLVNQPQTLFQNRLVHPLSMNSLFNQEHLANHVNRVLSVD